MSEQKRKIHAFSAVDLIILLGVAAVLCGFFLRAPLSERISGYFSDKRISILFETDEMLHTEIEIGDTVFSDGVEIGVVTNVSFLPKYEYKLDETNTPYFTEAMGRETVTFRVEGTGKVDKYGTYINGKLFIAPGETLQTYTVGDKWVVSRVKYVETTDKNG